MTTYNTGNPIGSTDARDRLDNSENMDILENSTTLNAHADRLGTMRKTRKGMELEHDNQMQSFENDFDSRLAGMAFTRVGTFTTGATLTDMRQTQLWEVSQGGDGHEYGWTGAFPKVVPPGSTPATSGGVGAGAWVDRTQDTLRSELQNFIDSSVYVYNESELDAALLRLIAGTIHLSNNLTISSQKLTDKNINIKSNGHEITWTGTSGTAIRYERSAYYTETASLAVTRGQHTIPISSASLEVGDIVVLEGPTVRWASVDGDYLYGQAVRITAKSGTTYTVDPAIIADYSVTSISAYKPFILDLDINIKAADTNVSDTSFINVGWCRDTKIKAAIHGSGPQNVGLGLSGDNVDVDITVTGIKHGFVNLGYGVSVSGNKIKVRGKGSDCKHVYDAGTRTFVSTSIEFDMDVTKAADAPLHLYACGVHVNTLSPKMRGRVFGCGHLVCDRTGSADIDIIFNETASSHSYGLILVNEMPPSSLKVRGKSSNALCSYVLNSPTGTVGCIGMDIQVEAYGKKIIFQQTLNQSVKGLKIHDCKGEFLKFYSNDWTGCDLDVELYNNRLNTISSPSSAYIQDHTAGGNIKIRSRNNIIDDTYVTGYFRFTGTITSIDFESLNDENKGTYRFIEAVAITTTAIKQFRILSPKTSAVCNLSLPTTVSLYETSGRVQEGQFKHATNPLSFSAWPCYAEANAFKLSSGINLATTIKPGPGNHDLNGNTITWNSTNQAWPQY